MKNAIILHGKPDKEEYYDPMFPSASNSHWIPWLQKQLFVYDIFAQTPEIPNSWNPDYNTWQQEFERFEITPETILVGHSCGGGFLMRWLSAHKDVTIAKLVLVAPWLDPNRDDTTDFFDFEIDPNLAQRVKEIMIFNSDNDFSSIQESVNLIRSKIPGIGSKEFHNYGHFTLSALKTEKFPELLAEILK